ncbi:helix-turn-helix domain-containing protein [Pedobacter chitinilyticus]|uniref:Helix-turn-helix domain-containing protein n=1 Tax=Pedobacter chitinilyticus TaxID=2233776 RepID=A0A3S3R497_9SPHI|nr:helix-turn-helix domain-containing protein [Pedobacter chitinilyticus]RWU04318.1 helix-turn-helix domain-containing protein [Pedobacter chitinilyticus]
MSTSKLAIYRRKRGLSQEQLSALSGVSARTIQRIEKGTVEAHLATLKLLADCLDVDTELLLEEGPTAAPTQTAPQKSPTLTPLFHASALVGMFFPILNIIIPGVLWFLKKDESPEYDRQGKQVINFQLTMSFAFVPAIFLLVFYFPVGFPLAILVYFYTMVMCLINLFKSINQKAIYYPLAYPFLK